MEQLKEQIADHQRMLARQERQDERICAALGIDGAAAAVPEPEATAETARDELLFGGSEADEVDIC